MKLKPSDLELGDRFGSSVGVDQDIAIVGAYSQDDDDVGTGAGAAYVFERDHGGRGQWGETAKLTAAHPAAEDSFGYSVAIQDGRAVSGSRHDDDGALDAGAAHVFVRVEPVLTVTGACPGAMTVALFSATPKLPVVLLGAASEGSAMVPVGPCAGTEIGLAEPRPLAVRRTDVNGELSLLRTVGGGVYGSFLQIPMGSPAK